MERRFKKGSLINVGGQIVFVMCAEKDFKPTSEMFDRVHTLRSIHEETDFRLLLHAQHVAENYQTLVFWQMSLMSSLSVSL